MAARYRNILITLLAMAVALQLGPLAVAVHQPTSVGAHQSGWAVHTHLVWAAVGSALQAAPAIEAHPDPGPTPRPLATLPMGWFGTSTAHRFATGDPAARAAHHVASTLLSLHCQLTI